MKVRLLKRLGQHPERSIVEYRDSEAHWLVRNGCAAYLGLGDTPELEALGPAATEPEPEPEVEGVEQGPSLAELKAQAEELGLKTYGTKDQIAARIAEHKGKQ